MVLWGQINRSRRTPNDRLVLATLSRPLPRPRWRCLSGYARDVCCGGARSVVVLAATDKDGGSTVVGTASSSRACGRSLWSTVDQSQVARRGRGHRSGRTANSWRASTEGQHGRKLPARPTRTANRVGKVERG